MKHIELIGVAGSGKSTVGSALRERNESFNSLTEMHSTVVSELLFPRKLSQIGARLSPKIYSHLARIAGVTDRGANYFSQKYPKVGPKTAEYIEKYTDDPRRRDYTTGAVLDLAETFGTVDEHASRNETLLIDEGFSFKAGAVFHPPQYTRRFAVEELREYVATLPVPDIIIFVRADPETCTQRLRNRESGPPRSWEQLETDSYLDFATEALVVAERIADAFEARGAEILEVETDGQSVEQSTTHVESQLRSLSSP